MPAGAPLASPLAALGAPEGEVPMEGECMAVRSGVAAGLCRGVGGGSAHTQHTKCASSTSPAPRPPPLLHSCLLALMAGVRGGCVPAPAGEAASHGCTSWYSASCKAAWQGYSCVCVGGVMCVHARVWLGVGVGVGKCACM